MNGYPRACGELTSDGWLSGARRVDSPNFDARPTGEAVSLIVVHAISLPPRQFGGDAIERLFTNTLDPDAHAYFATIDALRVSAHFLIRRDGELLQFVSCAQRAWHAGVSEWNGRPRCNDFSLGIELEGCDDLPFEELQYLRLGELIAELCAHYPIAALAGHSDIAPGRKTDPGPFFDWRRIGGRAIVQTEKESFMATRAKSKTGATDATTTEAVATPPKSTRRAPAGASAEKNAAGETKKTGKKAEKPADNPGKLAKHGAASVKSTKGVKVAKEDKAAKAGKPDDSPVNPVTAWPFPLEPRPQ